MDINEIRSSKEYVAAYAEYVKSIIRGEKADDSELRKLMTDNVETYGQVPVPTMVDDIVRTAWEDEKVLARVRKTYFKGNVKVAFERSADPAYNHAEGSTAPTEEALLLGIVTLLPENIKSGVSIFGVQGTYVAEEPKYRVTYNLNGGSNHSANPTTYRKSETPINLNDPYRDGYTFEGWAEGNQIPKGSTGDLEFNAIWKPIPQPEPEPEPEPIVEPIDDGEQEGGQG